VRVLHLQKVKGIGGSERHLLSLLPGLRDSGLEVRMCAATSADGYRFVEQMRRSGVDAVHMSAGLDINLRLGRAVAEQIRLFRPTLVHTHLLHGDLYGQPTARMCGVKSVSSFHSTHKFYTRGLAGAAERLAGRVACRTIAISEHVRDFLVRHRLRPPETIRVVPYGVVTSDWQLTPGQRAEARASLGLEDDDVGVGVASRLIPGKGHDLLMRAFAEAREAVPGLSLRIAGDGPLRGELETTAARLDHGAARLLGFVADMRAFMGACDIVVFPTQPSLSEGFGLAALEAMAAGRPVVASRLASLPEVVRDGQTGLLVAPGDVQALAKALARLGSDPTLRARFGGEAARRAAQEFELDRMVTGTIAVYREAVES
jgi:glycosyltransferase involved in cell wall biosynthesis